VANGASGVVKPGITFVVGPAGMVDFPVVQSIWSWQEPQAARLGFVFQLSALGAALAKSAADIPAGAP